MNQKVNMITPSKKAKQLEERFDNVDEMLNFVMLMIQTSDDPSYWEMVWKEFY